MIPVLVSNFYYAAIWPDARVFHEKDLTEIRIDR